MPDEILDLREESKWAKYRRYDSCVRQKFRSANFPRRENFVLEISSCEITGPNGL